IIYMQMFLLMSFVPYEVFGDSVQQDQTVQPQKEGGSVTLTCTYSTTNSNIYLHWYRKYPNGVPDYILKRGAKSYSSYQHTAEFAKGKFESNADSSTTRLTINNLQLSDTALYYCALEIA
uniref:Ig-like domain-containing protein n=1 Tax=Latimeria chalumnae TaxID=7897 RepID=H3B1D5_LATCH